MNKPDTELDPTERILQERARLLAQPPAAEVSGTSTTLLVLTVAHEHYGLGISYVQEVQAPTVVTPVPGLPPFWLGLANVRGLLLPVLSLRQYLGLAMAEPETHGRFVLLSAAGLSVALMVDEVAAVRSVLQSEIGLPLRGEGADRRPDLITGVTADLLAILDVEKLLSDPGLIVNDATA